MTESFGRVKVELKKKSNKTRKYPIKPEKTQKSSPVGFFNKTRVFFQTLFACRVAVMSGLSCIIWPCFRVNYSSFDLDV